MKTNTQPSFIDAVLSLVPDAIVQITEDTADGIIWSKEHNGDTPSFEEIQEEMIRLTEEYNATDYQRRRKAEYDKLNQDDLRFDDSINGTTTWQDAILAIKAKYPKGE